MRIDENIERVRREGEALAQAAESGPLDARITTCPEWDVEALLRHIGDVHRWAATIVREEVQTRLRRDFAGPAGGDQLLAWYREGVELLVKTLQQASPDSVFWFWGPAPSALAFWARRQANETAIHRRDAESARGEMTPLSTRDGIDCLDEWIGLLPRRVRAPSGSERTVQLHATDAEGDWSVRLGDTVEIVGRAATADCSVSGAASDLYLWSMNRQGAERLVVTGDTTLLDVWREHIRF